MLFVERSLWTEIAKWMEIKDSVMIWLFAVTIIASMTVATTIGAILFIQRMLGIGHCSPSYTDGDALRP